ncbi:MAG TPA: hypothetical protein VGN56_02160 [Candidatus Paceibacterota bacterium]|nr:hypothetical protein [Candidatus Paceibacterota bacterium]
MHKLTAFEPCFGMYLRTPAKRPARASRFASFTERERKYLAPKRVLRFKLPAPAQV